MMPAAQGMRVAGARRPAVRVRDPVVEVADLAPGVAPRHGALGRGDRGELPQGPARHIPRPERRAAHAEDGAVLAVDGDAAPDPVHGEASCQVRPDRPYPSSSAGACERPTRVSQVIVTVMWAATSGRGVVNQAGVSTPPLSQDSAEGSPVSPVTSRDRTTAAPAEALTASSTRACGTGSPPRVQPVTSRSCRSWSSVRGSPDVRRCRAPASSDAHTGASASAGPDTHSDAAEAPGFLAHSVLPP